MNQIGVRDLVSFILRSGDLNTNSNSTNTAQAGTRIHHKIQKQHGKDYQSEYYLEKTIQKNNHEFQVHGRADGVILKNNHATIEEIKTSDTEFPDLSKNRLQLYWGQVKVYAYLLMNEHPELERVDLDLVYVQTPEEIITKTSSSITKTEATTFFNQLVDEYQEWLEMQEAFTKERILTAQRLPFPFPAYRKGQRELAKIVYKSVMYQKHLFVEAPTGTGKTISTLFPAIKAMGLELTSRIFYLTAKQSTRRVAEEALQLLSEKGLVLHSITLTAKDKIRFKEEEDVRPEDNPYMIGYYDRLKPALKDLLTHENQITRSVIEDYAKKYSVDPFEFSLDASLFCDVIIGDYNYLFDPRVHLTRFFEVENSDNFFLIDEAHNLVNRSREMYSTEINSAPIRPLIKLLQAKPEKNKPVLTKLKSLNRYFNKLAKEMKTNKQTSLTESEENEKLTKLVNNLIKVLRKWLAKEKPSTETDQVLDYFFECIGYQKINEFFGPNYKLRTLLTERGITVRLFCIDPSPFLADSLKLGGGAVLFSATLSPMDYYQNVLGDEPDSLKYQTASPFPAKNQKLLITSYVDTRYQQRQASLVKIVQSIKTLIEQKDGNYLIFAPSYQYLEMVVTAFHNAYPEIEIVTQTNQMNDEERQNFLAKFNDPQEHPIVGFALLGGIFSEGIDLVGDKLIGVGIIGVGLPGLNQETNLIRDYFDKQNGHGFQYAYQLPGLNNVFQAAGRLIRGNNDKGIILLMDNRFLNKNYNVFFPKTWYTNTVVHNLNELKNKIKEFW
ncbi:helicase C-terminal domain-containing protein [Fructilactobacillus vespulae]